MNLETQSTDPQDLASLKQLQRMYTVYLSYVVKSLVKDRKLSKKAKEFKVALYLSRDVQNKVVRHASDIITEWYCNTNRVLQNRQSLGIYKTVVFHNIAKYEIVAPEPGVTQNDLDLYWTWISLQPLVITEACGMWFGSRNTSWRWQQGNHRFSLVLERVLANQDIHLVMNTENMHEAIRMVMGGWLVKFEEPVWKFYSKPVPRYNRIWTVPTANTVQTAYT